MRKKHEKYGISLFVVITILFSATIVSAQNKNDFIGTWNYEAPYAPYGYEKGKILMSFDKDNELIGEVEFQDGYKIKMKDIEIKENKLIFGINIDYEYIKTEVSVKEKKMKGIVNSPNGKIELTANKN